MSHLTDVRETYSEHFKFATMLGFLLLKAGLAALIHAVIPSIFVTSASDTLKEINELMAARNDDSEPLDEDKELFI